MTVLFSANVNQTLEFSGLFVDTLPQDNVLTIEFVGSSAVDSIQKSTNEN